MKSIKMINTKALILFLIAILLVLSMPMAAFADDENQLKEEDMPGVGSFEGFWMRYDPEDIDYHVTDNMEKICILDDEEPLEIKIEKEENDGSLIEHFLDVTVSHVHTSLDDMTRLYFEPENTPDYDVFEEDGVLSFIFSKDALECPNDIKRYEFLFTFDDGQAYSLVWVTKETDKLEYTEGGHVWATPVPDITLEDLGISLPTATDKAATGSESTQVIAEDVAEDIHETNNITAPVIVACVLAVAFALIILYHSRIKNR